MLQPQPPAPVPTDTARVACAAFPKGSALVALRDELGAVFSDDDFAALYPPLGQPAYPPWRLALVTVLQFREGLSDRAAADAVRAWIDWKYLLGLSLDDPGFDFSVLSEFRSRLVEHGAEQVLLDRIVDARRDRGLLKARGRQRTDSAHVVAAVRELNGLEFAAETVCGCPIRNGRAQRVSGRGPRLAPAARSARVVRPLRPPRVLLGVPDLRLTQSSGDRCELAEGLAVR